MAAALKCQSVNNLNLCANGTLQECIKCFFCDKFLSVPPIYSHEHESICGRCKFVNKPEDSKWTRQTLYEEIAKFMLFPCSNVSYGCSAQLPWGEVEEHENTCLYKKLSCPFTNDDIFMTERCKWTGSGPGLNEHLENCHGDLIKKLSDLNLSETHSNCIFLTRNQKQLMIITIKFQAPDKFSFLVMVNGISTDCDAYRYQLELFDENRKNSVIFRRNRLEDAVGFEENFNNAERSLNFNLSTISDLLKDPEVIMARIGVLKKSKKDAKGFNHSFNTPNEALFDDNFLRELECPVCKNYMVPPIQICATGHSFCLNCKEQMTECPTCRHPFQEGRNYTLEKISSCVNYPCMFREAGCPMSCSGEKIRAHELDCSFSGTSCFFNCSNGNIMNMFKHLNEKHHDSLIVSGDIHLLDVGEVGGDDLFKVFAICFGNDIFRLAVKYDGGLTFSVQQFGVQQPSYSYEIEIIYSNECLEKVILGKQCLPLTADIWKQSIDLPAEMIEGFISDEDLIFFKVHLKK